MSIHGWIFVDKPVGVTSTRVGSILKRLSGQRKIGHVGTLDPLASGVLIFALGEATKLIPYRTKGTKGYDFTITWGEQRTTDDAEGDAVGKSSVRPSLNEIKAALAHFTGNIDQVPPVYAAIHIDGKRAYEYARAGEPVEIPKRRVCIHSLTFLNATEETASFSVTCSEGTYVRALARDLALHLGTLGYISFLRRTHDGTTVLDQTIPLEILKEKAHNSNIAACVHAVGSVLDDIPAVTVSDVTAVRLRNGQPVDWSPENFLSCVRMYEESGNLIGMGTIDAGVLYPKRLLTL